ncbi:MAG: sigma-54 dependent transcriptional regulator [candidate division KSB1 bacterium]|nr:sigma-54 dependent transcriptional regulator [candidate division KSB1 bacterium]
MSIREGIFRQNLAWKDLQSMPMEQFEETYSFHGIVCQSMVMHEICQLIQKVSATDVTVLIYGESGTGKELVARNIHLLSKRAEKPFIPVDCNALPVSLMESELFGYEKGAFTGANKSKSGLLEYAQGGTFFLDELTSLDLNLQGKLLRVLQERVTRRIGSTEQIPIDVRIIAATNINPQLALKRNKLRLDLYYRLNVVPIHMPPLRERKDDIPLLLKYYSYKIAEKEGIRVRPFSKEAVELLQSYHWPGNIRELKNIVERLQILCETREIQPDHVLKIADIGNKLTADREQKSILQYNVLRAKVLAEFERNYIHKLLRIARGNISLATRISGLTRPTIYRMVKEYIPNKNFREFAS